MGIFDEAIREHLELKRQHGADGSELKQLEDEAFGQAERPGNGDGTPDPAAEAPTQFMEQPEIADKPGERREPTITDLQEGPPSVEEPVPAAEESPAVEEPVNEAPAEEEHPAMEHEIVDASEAAEPEIEPAGPSTEERHAIAEQPTELHDMEEELGAEPPNPTDEELVEEEIAEPRLASANPLAALDEDDDVEVSIKGPAPVDDEDDEDDAFWNEQRLSDELDQALDAPIRSETELAEEPESELGDEPDDDDEPEAAAPRAEDDVLEETPDFLEETPEDDQLWFEQKPPKDFDFDD